MRSSKLPVVLLSVVGATITYFYIQQFRKGYPIAGKLWSNRKNTEELVMNGRMLEKEPIPGENNIIFIETRCTLDTNNFKGVGLDLNKRQACTIESAARMNKDTKIYIFYSCPIRGSVKESSSHVIQLFSYPNVFIRELNIPQFLIGTPLQNWDFKRKISESKWPVEHSSDVLRFVSIWKYGGIYLDLDVVVKRDFKELGTNYVARQDEGSIAACVINFDFDKKARKISKQFIEKIATDFDGTVWSANGPGIVTTVMKSLCNTQNVPEMNSERCQGIKVLSSDFFTPIPYGDRMDLFGPEISKSELKYNKSYGVHMWNHLTKMISVSFNTPTAYGNLAKQYCPNVHAHSGLNFNTES